ncbi:MAG: flagellar biosynthetic protein FliO [Spirochaetaceae bacterium]
MRVKLLFILLFFSISLYSQETEVDKTPDENSTEKVNPLRVDETTLKINTPADQVPEGQAPLQVNPIGATEYLRVVLILVFVLLALYFVLKFIKKVGGARIGIDNDLIHVISTRALKGSTALHLIEVGTQIFLVGASDSNVNSIAEITDQESKDRIALNLSTEAAGSKSFVQYFTDKLNINNGTVAPEEEPNIKTQKEKLDRF